jgi:hypothetical protein
MFMIRSLFDGEKYTTEELNARLKFFIGIILGLTLFGIVFVVLYSLIFVTQPMNGMSPVDNKFFELIIPIATFLTGTLSGIMLAGDDKEMRKAALDAANKPYTPPPPPPSTSGGGFGISDFRNPFSRKEPTVDEFFEKPKFDYESMSSGQVVTGFGGKSGPAPINHPEI